MPSRRRSSAPQVNFTHPEKIYFPGSGTTKGEVVQYYIDVAEWMLPHLEDRPVTLIRFPNGYGGESFYEKNAPSHAPDWIDTFNVPRRRHEGTIRYILINRPETLAWCANLGAIELHPFLHRAPQIDRPTHLAFDLDPGEGADLATCAEVAFLVRDLLGQLGLEAWPKVTGSKGLQLYVPLNTPTSYEVTSPFAKAVAEYLERQHPDLVVSNMAKTLRKKRVLIDWSQNSESKTTVAVYAVRAKRDQPFISMPVDWDELQRLRRTGRTQDLFFSPQAALARLRKRGDLFAPVLKVKQRLPAAFAAKLGGDAGDDTESKSAKKPRRTSSALKEYAAKRDFSVTAEPPPRAPEASPKDAPRFVIQKHAASHLHYDFRLELEGTLKSWAVPKGLPTELDVRRSGFQTEDHPLEYLDFEGTIPKGQYGGGTVMVWDIGTFRVLSGHPAAGKLRVELKGKKLKGVWQLYRIRKDDDKPVWLIEKRDEAAKTISERQDDRSVLSGRSMDQIAAANDAQWTSNRAEKSDAAPVQATKSTKSRRKPAAARRKRVTRPRRRTAVA